jgi:hypothetical protein
MMSKTDFNGGETSHIYPGAAKHDINKQPGNPLSPASAELFGDLLTRLDFDMEVNYYEFQPVSILYTDAHGDSHIYAPELLVTYQKVVPKVAAEGGLRYATRETRRRPLLCDVMLREDLFENWKELKPKFKAARAFAGERGWSFKILTERNISTPYLLNAKFLLPYKHLPEHTEYSRLILIKLRELRRASAEQLIAACSNDYRKRAELIPSIWGLVANGRIGADLICPVTMDSALWLLN